MHNAPYLMTIQILKTSATRNGAKHKPDSNEKMSFTCFDLANNNYQIVSKMV